MHRNKFKDKGFFFRGIEYESFANCCRKFNVISGTIDSNARYNNITKQEALERHLAKERGFLFRGIEYKSFNECCREFNVPPCNIKNNARNNNIAKQEALEQYLAKERGFIFRRVEYKSFKECCRKFNVFPSYVCKSAKRNNITKQEVLEQYLLRHPEKEKGFPFRGIEYKSFTACCREFNVHPDAIYTSVRRHNITKQEALERYLTRDRSFSFRGVGYKTFVECCNIFGVSSKTVLNCAYIYTLTKQEALEHVLKNPYPEKYIHKFSFRGADYATFKDCCIQYGAKPRKIADNAYRKGISKNEALEQWLTNGERVRRKSHSFPFRDVVYNTFRDCCKEFAVKPETIYYIARVDNLSLQDALEKKIGRYFSFRNVRYNSFKCCCRAFNQSDKKVKDYSEKFGCTLQESLEYFLSGGDNCYTVGKIFVFRGISYPSYMECCRQFGIGYGTVSYSAKVYGITRQDALEIHITGINPYNKRKKI